jgi:hypothetical protein
MYDVFNAYLDKKIETVEVEIETISIMLEPLKERLIQYKHIIEEQFPFESVLAGYVKELKTVETQEQKYVNIQVVNYYKLYLPIKQKEEYLKTLNKQKAPFPVYRFVINTFNILATIAMIKEGYVLDAKRFGKLYVNVKYSKRTRINWGASLKIKNQLEKEGKIPYSKEEALEAEKKGEVYEGIKWQVLHPNIDIWFQWNYIGQGVTNQGNYAFRPARGKHSPVTKLNEHKKELQPLDYVKYKGFAEADKLRSEC